MDLLSVTLGGALGASLRYGMAVAIVRAIPRPAIPLSTLAANLLGSLALGLVLGALFGRVPAGLDLLQQPWAVFLAVGFCGSFTTFSTFSMEMTHLLRDLGLPRAVLYLIATIAGSVGSFLAGFLLSA